MMDPATIQHMTDENSRTARTARAIPYLIWKGDIEDWRAGKRMPIPFPNIGDYEPENWVADGPPVMVDTSGWGERGEPALTLEQLLDWLQVGKAYAFVESGQFQSYIQQFSKKEQTT